MSRDAKRASAQQQIERWEVQLGDQLLALFERQEGVVLARLQGTKSRRGTRHWTPAGSKALDPRYILDPARWLLEAVNVARELIARLFGDVITRVWTGLGAPSDVPMPADEAVAAQVEARLEQVAVGVNTASEVIRDVIARGEDEGHALDRIAEDVRKTYAEQRQGWVSRIVTTNVVGAMNEASLSAATAAGSESKQWLASHDVRVRPTHVQADGQVVAIADRFELGGFDSHPNATLAYPGDPDGPAQEVINCRCTLLFPQPQLGERPYVGPGTKREYVRDDQGRFADVPGAGVDAPDLAGMLARVRAGEPDEQTMRWLRARTEMYDEQTETAVRITSAVVAAQTEGPQRGQPALTVDYTFETDGREVGTATRTYRDDGSVEHVEFVLDYDAQGQGLATRWNRQTEEAYRELGVDRITLNANIDVGGYAWARQGYDWNVDFPSPLGPAGVAEARAFDMLERAESQFIRPDDTETLADLEQMYALFGQPDTSQWPTPFEVSELGRGRGYEIHPGMSAMLGASWPGVKHLV